MPGTLDTFAARYGGRCAVCGVVRDYHRHSERPGNPGRHAFVAPRTPAEYAEARSDQDYQDIATRRRAEQAAEDAARRQAAETLPVLLAAMGGTFERFRFDAGTSIVVRIPQPGGYKRFSAEDGASETAEQQAVAWLAYRKDGGSL